MSMGVLHLVIRHFGWMSKLGQVLGARLRTQALVLAAVGIFDALLELLTISSVIPFMALAADPASTTSQALLNRAAQIGVPIDPKSALIVMALAIVASLIIRAGVKWLSVRLTSRFSVKVRNETARRLLTTYVRQPFERQLRANPNRRLSMVTGDAINISSLASETIVLSGSVATAAAMAAMMFFINWRVTAIAIILIGTIGASTYLFLFRRMRRLGDQAMKERLAASAMAARLLQGYREAAIYDRDESVCLSFSESNDRMGDALRRVAVLRQSPIIWSEFLLGTAVVFGLLFLAVNSDFTSALPLAVAFAVAALRLAPAAVRAIASAAQLRFYVASLEAVYRDLTAVDAVTVEVGNNHGVTYEQSIIFENVSFSYADAPAPAIADIDAVIPQGTMLGVCGPSGSGKSTFVNLLMGLLVPSSGQISIDGRPLAGGERAWQKLIALVPQDPFFWNGSIRENLLFGRNFPDADERIWRALDRAHAGDFVRQIPKGISSQIGERGARLSGGQRQRLAIARALVGNPELVVLDEPTSALDHEIAQAIDEALSEMKGKQTLVIVAHRASSIARCDSVLYFVGGHISHRGSFSEIVANDRSFSNVLGISDQL